MVSSFTIEFPEHLPSEKRQYVIGHLSDTGATIEPVSDGVFRVICLKNKELEHVGWALFHTHFSHCCRVIETSGKAENKASAYAKPPAT